MRKKETLQERGIEGRIVTGRQMLEYEADLFFRRSLFKGKRVLNFGCGGSNLSGELKRDDKDHRLKGREDRVIGATIVEVDKLADPVCRTDKYTGAVKPPFALWYRMLDTVLPEGSEIRRKYIERRRRRFGTSDRTFVQADGRHLPFADRTFDIVIANNATYQIPEGAKEQVFSELLRVGNALHVGEIKGREFDLLERLGIEQGYEIIFSNYYNHNKTDARMRDVIDYTKYQQAYPYEERVQGVDGACIIMRRVSVDSS